MRMIVDVSSLLWQSLLAGADKEYGFKVEHEGKQVHVNGWQFGLQCAVNHLESVMRELELSAGKLIFVVEGKFSKARRKLIYSGYKESRDSRPPQAYDQFAVCKDKLIEKYKALGAQVCTGAGVEADDIIAYLARRMSGDIVILTRDGDMTTLVNERVSLWQDGRLTRENKYGPFPHTFVPVYKALVGDGEEYKGAYKFGKTAFLDLLVWGGNGALAALEGMIQRKQLHELEDDVAEFKPMRRIIDSAQHVYESYECALLHDEWVNTKRQPLLVEPVNADWWLEINPPPVKVVKQYGVFDAELIGTENPVFLVCTRELETGVAKSFFMHREGDMEKLKAELQREDMTWVSFNGIHFDSPVVSAAIGGMSAKRLKLMANAIVTENGRAWEMPDRFGYDPIEFDHIDLMEVSPGVKISLKTFAGRMGYKTMVDLPFEHDKDLTAEEIEVLEIYCQNDLGVTEELFNRLRTEVELRIEMGEEADLDLRSKSDAQVAEALLKKAANIRGRGGKIPLSVTYKAPAFIQTDSDVINDIVERLERTEFAVNQGNGQVMAPDFLADPVQLGYGTYQMGVGGLHSTHDKQLYVEADDDTVCISDIDVSSYYPFTMVNAGIIPKIERGQAFLDAYKKILFERIAAKRRMTEIEIEIAEIEKELANG